jgi:hypothetical protein
MLGNRDLGTRAWSNGIRRLRMHFSAAQLVSVSTPSLRDREKKRRSVLGSLPHRTPVEFSAFWQRGGIKPTPPLPQEAVVAVLRFKGLGL